jgi:GT2 family glycosyltransferase
MMPVTVILVAYHGDRWLPACLDSLVHASAARLHVVLVDNTGNTLLDRLDYSGFDIERLQTPSPMGFAEANNFALTQASRLEPAVLFLNQDTVSLPGWIDRCLDCFSRDGDLGAVSPLIRTYDGTDWDPSFLDCLPDGAASADRLEDKASTPWFYTALAPAPALIVRRSVLQEAGPFDPVFGSYYEDYDLCHRIRRCGNRVGFCRTASIHHFSGSTTTTQARELVRMRQIIRNRVLFNIRASDKPRLQSVMGYAVLDFPRRLFRGVMRTPSSQPPAVTLKAYRDLLRISGRLVSRRRDEAAWRTYLAHLGWPNGNAGLVATE